MPLLLEFQNISRKVENKTLLHSASGQIFDGDRIALIGNSGSGKSVLLRTLSRLEPCQSGTMHYRNTTLAPQAWRAHIAYLFQTPILDGDSVEACLRAPYTFQYHRKQTFSPAFHISRLATLGKDADFLNSRPDLLSGGERQIVNLLRTLQFSPNLLLLDEPTAALDPDSKIHLETLIRQWADEQPDRAYIWISHDPQEADRIANRRWQMHQGSLTTDEPRR